MINNRTICINKLRLINYDKQSDGPDNTHFTLT